MSFQKILDQPAVVRTLRAAIEKDRIAHAYVFVGPSGVGRKRTAFTFAKSLNCETPDGRDPCGTCGNCRLIDGGKHPDVQTLMPMKRSSTIRVEQVMNLLAFAYMRPMKGKYKVFVLCEADRLGAQAANKLLKTLEEPAPFTVFILITERSQNLMPTVASRCQPVKFGRLRTESVARILASEFHIEPERAAVAAGLADGQVTRGLQFADPQRLETVLGIVQALENYPARMAAYDGLLEFFARQRETIQNQAEEEISGFGEELASDVSDSIEDLRKSFVERHYREFLNECLGLLLTLYRDVLVLKRTDTERIIINRDKIELLRDRASVMSFSSILRNMEHIEEASEYCSHYVGEDRVFMDLLLRLRHE